MSLKSALRPAVSSALPTAISSDSEQDKSQPRRLPNQLHATVSRSALLLTPRTSRSSSITPSSESDYFGPQAHTSAPHIQPVPTPSSSMSRTAPLPPHAHHHHHQHPSLSAKSIPTPPSTVPGSTQSAAGAGGGGGMDLPPIRPLGERYDGSPMPSFLNIAGHHPTSATTPKQADSHTQASVHVYAQPAHGTTRPAHAGEGAAAQAPPRKKARKAPLTPGSALPSLPTLVSSSATTSAPSTAQSSTPAPPPPAKRGRKPTHTSRAARDTARKVNHSRIEKRRRERINDALSALRRLVPREEELDRMRRGEVPAFRSDDSAAGGEEEAADGGEPGGAAGGKKGKGKGKEFKLEVLDRTVAYVRFLIERVQASEGELQGALRSGAVAPLSTLKRKREESDEEDSEMGDDAGDGEGEGEKDEGEEDDEGETEESDMDDEEEDEGQPRNGTGTHGHSLATTPYAGPTTTTTTTQLTSISPSPPAYPLLPTPTTPFPYPTHSSSQAYHPTHATHTSNAKHPSFQTRTSAARSQSVSPGALLPSPPASGRQGATISPTSQPPVLKLPEPSLPLSLRSPEYSSISTSTSSGRESGRESCPSRLVHARSYAEGPSQNAGDGEEEAKAAASVLLQLKDVSPRVGPVDSSSPSHSAHHSHHSWSSHHPHQSYSAQSGTWRLPSLSPHVRAIDSHSGSPYAQAYEGPSSPAWTYPLSSPLSAEVRAQRKLPPLPVLPPLRPSASSIPVGLGRDGEREKEQGDREREGGEGRSAVTPMSVLGMDRPRAGW